VQDGVDAPQWAHRKPDDQVYDGLLSYSDAGNDTTFAEAKTKRDVQDAEWIIFGDTNGRIHSWCDFYIETPEQETWLRDGVSVALDLIIRDKP